MVIIAIWDKSAKMSIHLKGERLGEIANRDSFIFI